MIQRLADWMRTKATRKMFLCVPLPLDLVPTILSLSAAQQ